MRSRCEKVSASGPQGVCWLACNHFNQVTPRRESRYLPYRELNSRLPIHHPTTPHALTYHVRLLGVTSTLLAGVFPFVTQEMRMMCLGSCHRCFGPVGVYVSTIKIALTLCIQTRSKQLVITTAVKQAPHTHIRTHQPSNSRRAFFTCHRFCFTTIKDDS